MYTQSIPIIDPIVTLYMNVKQRGVLFLCAAGMKSCQYAIPHLAKVCLFSPGVIADRLRFVVTS